MIRMREWPAQQKPVRAIFTTAQTSCQLMNRTQTALQNPWIARLLTTLVWALAAASIMFWVLQIGNPSQSQSGMVAVPPAPTPQATGMAYLLGYREKALETPAAPVQARSKYQLIGVLAGTQSQQGSALIAVDDQSAKLYRVGATVEGSDQFILQALHGRQAQLGSSLQGEALQTLEMPEFKPGKTVASNTSAPAFRPPGTQARPPLPPTSQVMDD